MSDTYQIAFACPYCQCTHTRHMDAGVFYAELHFYCDTSAGGCGDKFLVRYLSTSEVQTQHLTPPMRYRDDDQQCRVLFSAKR